MILNSLLGHFLVCIILFSFKCKPKVQILNSFLSITFNFALWCFDSSVFMPIINKLHKTRFICLFTTWTSFLFYPSIEQTRWDFQQTDSHRTSLKFIFFVLLWIPIIGLHKWRMSPINCKAVFGSYKWCQNWSNHPMSPSSLWLPEVAYQRLASHFQYSIIAFFAIGSWVI